MEMLYSYLCKLKHIPADVAEYGYFCLWQMAIQLIYWSGISAVSLVMISGKIILMLLQNSICNLYLYTKNMVVYVIELLIFF